MPSPTRSTRLLLVLTLLEKQLAKAREALQAAQQVLQQEQQKMQQLQAYYDDYATGINAPQQPLKAQDISRQRSLLNQLMQAKKQQQQLVQNRQQLVKNKYKLWHLAYLKKNALTQLIEKLKKNEALALTKKEEKRLDEWTLQALRRKESASL